MTLGQKQRLFTHLVGKLILKAYELGYDLYLGDAYRSPEVAEQMAREGRGIRNSLHCERLAIDLNLFKNGKYLTKSEHHRPLGEWWKQQHPLCRWGGDFSKPDGNHYSMAHQGRA